METYTQTSHTTHANKPFYKKTPSHKHKVYKKCVLGSDFTDFPDKNFKLFVFRGTNPTITV